MNVGLMVERFAPTGGGLESWTWQLAHALVRRGHDVSVLTFHATSRPAHAALRVITLPWHDDRMQRAVTAEHAAAGMPLDVTHDLGICTRAKILHPQAGSRLANAQRDLRGRTALGQIAARLDPRRARWLHQLKTFEECRYPPPHDCLVIAVSHVVAADLKSWHGVPADQIRIVPNGIDTAQFAPPIPAMRNALRERLGVSGRLMFLFVARNPHLKGIGPLLRAFARARARSPHMMLVAVGTHPDARIRRDVRLLGLQESVRFDGAVDDVLGHYQAADALVLPSWHDACSLSVLEACACGLPVVTTRANGASELLSQGIDGHIIGSAADVDALTGALLDLTCADTRARMSAHARQCALRNDFGVNVDAIERVYQQSASRLGSRAHGGQLP